MLQLHLIDQQFDCLLTCVLYWRTDGTYFDIYIIIGFSMRIYIFNCVSMTYLSPPLFVPCNGMDAITWAIFPVLLNETYMYHFKIWTKLPLKLQIRIVALKNRMNILVNYSNKDHVVDFADVSGLSIWYVQYCVQYIDDQAGDWFNIKMPSYQY